MQNDNALLLDILILEQDAFIKVKRFRAIRILVCMLFLIYVDYRIMMAEWDGDLTLFEKNCILQVKILSTVAVVFLLMEAINNITSRSRL